MTGQAGFPSISCIIYCNGKVSLQYEFSNACLGWISQQRLHHNSYNWKGFFSSVNSQMEDQVGFMSKGGSTHITVERFFSSVNSKMADQVGFLSKGGSTHITVERFLTNVSSQVIGQDGFLSKGCITNRTVERFLTSVSSQVNFQGSFQSKICTTTITVERFLSSVSQKKCHLLYMHVVPMSSNSTPFALLVCLENN